MSVQRMRASDDTAKTALRELLLADFGGFNRRLSQRLGSEDFASEVLQETYLRIDRMKEAGLVRNPKAYLFRIAVNIANDHRRAERRRLTEEEIERLIEIPDDRPDAARVIEARSEVNLLKRAIAELPERRRKILVSSRVEGIPHREIAHRLGVTVRTVEMDLKKAVEHCAERLQRARFSKFASRPPGASLVQRRAAHSQHRSVSAPTNALDRDETIRFRLPTAESTRA